MMQYRHGAVREGHTFNTTLAIEGELNQHFLMHICWHIVFSFGTDRSYGVLLPLKRNQRGSDMLSQIWQEKKRKRTASFTSSSAAPVTAKSTRSNSV